MQTEGIEVLTGMMSAAFGIMLLYWGDESLGFSYSIWYAILCFLAAFLKLWGVVWQRTLPRILGLFAGIVVWGSVTAAFLSVEYSISWLAFLVLGLVQGWALWRIGREGQ
jgi:hypothetical protein